MNTDYNINKLIGEIKNKKTVLFYGAGAAKAPYLNKMDLLPDGKEMKYQLLCSYYAIDDIFKTKDIKNAIRQIKSLLKSQGMALEESKHFETLTQTRSPVQASDALSNVLEDIFKEEFKLTYSLYIAPEVVWEKTLGGRSEGLSTHIHLLNDMFDSTKPVPWTYRYIASLFFSEKPVFEDLITTNFDEKMEAAFRMVVSSNKELSKYATVTVVNDEDFSENWRGKRNLKLLYKLHGTLSRPSTIISSASQVGSVLSGKKKDILEQILKSNDL